MSVRREYNEIVESLLDELELLRDSGVYHLKEGSAGSTPAAAKPPESGREDETVLDGLKKEIGACVKCVRHKDKTGAVAGAGNPGSEIVFVGGCPDAADVRSGAPYSDEAGEQLDKIIKWMGDKLGFKDFGRKDVYLCYAVKCAASRGLKETQEAVKSCAPFLKKEIEAISPKVIVALGPVAAMAMTGINDVKKARGRFHRYAGIPLMTTYAPEELIKDPMLKKEAFSDLSMVISMVIEELKKEELKTR